MRLLTVLSVVADVRLVAASGLAVDHPSQTYNRHHVGDGVVQVDFDKEMIETRVVHPLSRREEDDKVWQSDIINKYSGYFIKVGVGSTSQQFKLHLDTGSADIWIPAPSACQGMKKEEQARCASNSFNISESDTAVIVGPEEFNIRYLDESNARGDYFTDDIEIAGTTVYDQEMGLGVMATIPYGIAGIGYHHIEQRTRPEGETYTNLPVQMYNQGLINTVAYSLWMSDLDAEKGSLLFGGIDASKFMGHLRRVPVLQNDYGWYDYFTVPLYAIQVGRPDGNTQVELETMPQPVVLDTGATLSYLPQDTAEQLWREVGAVWLPGVDAPMLPCKARTSWQWVAFQFGDSDGPSIDVPMSELVLAPSLMPGGRPIIGMTGAFKGVDLCHFGIRNRSDVSILGNTFQRSAFLVHDLINHEAALAQASLNATKPSKIIPFSEYGARIPETN